MMGASQASSADESGTHTMLAAIFGACLATRLVWIESGVDNQSDIFLFSSYVCVTTLVLYLAQVHLYSNSNVDVQSSNEEDKNIHKKILLANGKTLDDMVSIEDPSLIRKARADDLLRNLGELLQSMDSGVRQGETLFDLSEHIGSGDKIKTFISHTWRCNRWVKFLTLTTYFRGSTAIWIGTAGALFGCIVQWTGLTGSLGVYEELSLHTGNLFLRGNIAFWIGNSLMMLLLFTSIGGKFPWTSSENLSIFFDKICINTQDPAQRLKGINSLGGILHSSERLVVLWNEAYFERLWCVFELACFTATHRDQPKRIIFVPMSGAVATMCLACSCFILIALQQLFEIQNMMWPTGPLQIVSVVIGFTGFGIGYSVAYWAIDQHVASLSNLKEQLDNFSVKKCKVFSESDRPVVEGCINAWFGSLADFDNFVRTEIKPLVSTRLRLCPPDHYVFLLFAGWHHLFFGYDVAPHGDFRGKGFADCMYYFTDALVLTPLKLSALVPLAQAMQKRNFSSMTRVVLGGQIYLNGDFAIGTFVLPLIYKRESSLLIAVTFFSFAYLLWCLYNPSQDKVIKAEPSGTTAKLNGDLETEEYDESPAPLASAAETDKQECIAAGRPRHQVEQFSSGLLVGVSTALLQHFRAQIVDHAQLYMPVDRKPGDTYRIAEPKKRLDGSNATTSDVVEQLIKPTSKNGSYIKSATSLPQNSTGPANVFVSHAWTYKILDLIDILIEMGNENSGYYFWLDILIVDQNDTGHLPHTFWSVTFKNAIRDIGHTVVVLSPWDHPTPLTRAWCLWEMFCSMDNGIRFDIKLPKAEQMKLRNGVEKDFDVLTEAMMRVDAERAQAHQDSDRARIFSAIRRLPGGFHTFNLTIKKMLRDWVFRTLLSEFKQMEEDYLMGSLLNHKKEAHVPRVFIDSDNPMRDDDSQEKMEKISRFARFAFNLGRIFVDAGKLKTALEYHLKAFEVYKQLGNMYSIACSHASLGKLYTKLAKLDLAREHLEAALSIQEDHIGIQYFAKLCETDGFNQLEIHEGYQRVNRMLAEQGVKASLGQLYLGNPRSEEWIFGVWITSIASTFRGLGSLYGHMGRYSVALEFLQKAYNVYQKVHDGGEECPYFKDVSRPYLLAKTVSAIGDIEAKIGKTDEAMNHHRLALQIRESVLGESHPAYAESTLKIGNIAACTGNVDDALAHVQRAVRVFEENDGVDHVSTASGYVAVGNVYRSMGHYESALKYHHKAYDIHVAAFGEQHPVAASSYAEIAYTHIAAAQATSTKACHMLNSIYDVNHREARQISAAANALKAISTSVSISSDEGIGSIYDVIHPGYQEEHQTKGEMLLAEIVSSVGVELVGSRCDNDVENEDSDVGSPLLSPGYGFVHRRSSFMNNPCFAGDCCVLTPVGHVRISELKKGDSVLNGKGTYSTVKCIVVCKCPGGAARFVEFPGGLRITPFHPIRIDGVWKFPQDIEPCGFPEVCDAVYNLVLADSHVVLVNGIECVTLAHCFSESTVVAHEYLGSKRVLADLMKMPGWKDGCVMVGCVRRDVKSKRINGFDTWKSIGAATNVEVG